jgi:hypothetical protein
VSAELEQLGEGEAQQVKALSVEPADMLYDFTADTLAAAPRGA